MTQRLSQAAAFLCRTEEFHRYIERKRGLLYGCVGEHQAAQWLRDECEIKSRGQLDDDPVCATAFELILREYRRSLAESAA